MAALFEKYGKTDYIKFDRVERKRSRRPDLHAFLLLDELVPGARDIVCGSQHDVFYLDVEPGDLAAVVTDAQVLELVRCGVMHSEADECLRMFS
jgi:hypothetical protein